MAWLYKSGVITPVESEHIHELQKLGVASIEEAVALGFVRIRRHGDKTAFQARSRDLARKAARLFFETNPTTDVVAIEFPGRYVELSPTELCDFL